ncbi:MAG TPA: FAD-dependent oxidoreductase [Candidatus Rubneribacter avistercoris]|nr:FAD-dependent oxidoreductase [Candidatus Rubneribacter avistercoris]
MEARGLSRRAFLQGVGLAAAAGAAGGALAACSPGGGAGGAGGKAPDATAGQEAQAAVEDWAADTEELGEPQEVLNVDVCVVGAGGTGLAASMQSVQNGLSVVCLEKNGAPGGSFICTEGMAAIGTHWQAAEGVEIHQDKLIADLMAYHHWIPDYALYRAFLENSADAIDWLESLECNFQRVRAFGPSYQVCHEYAGDPARGLGSQFVESMVAAAEKLNVDIRCNTPAKRLVVEDGNVVGVLAVDEDDRVIKVECSSVIIATGGYGNNPAMLKALAGVDPDKVVASGMPGHDGDGIRMAHNAGAALCWDAGVANFYGNILIGSTYGSHVSAACSLQPVLWVNEKAQRYVNEDMFALNFPFNGMAHKGQKSVFTIMDQAIIDKFTNEGTQVEVGAAAPTGTPYDTLPDDIQSMLDQGNEHIFIEDSIEALAESAGLDPQALADTVKRYNDLCAAGTDTEFGKNPDFLVPIETGPFYAFEVGNGFFTTVGGIRVSTKAEALDENDEPIGGLYVCGMDSSGFYGDCYDAGVAPGSTAGWAIVSARLAANAAKERAGK